MYQMNWLGINWATTLAGIGQILGSLAGIAIAVATGNIPGIVTSVIAGIGGVSGGIGLINAKDKNVTGGTVPQTSEAVTRSTSAPISAVASASAARQ